MHDNFKRPYREPVTAMIHHAPPIRRIRWTTVGPLIVGAVGVILAAATLAMFLLWKGSVAAQISQLHQEVTAAQQAQAQAAGTVSGLSFRIHGLSSALTSMSALLSSFSSTCQTDLNGPNGPAAFDFLCKPG